MKKLVIALAILVMLPSLGAAAVIVVPPVPEQVVEGHTVFTVIEARVETNVTEERFAAAVAVLVREAQIERRVARFPGVLWFNDQYLINPEASDNRNDVYRYPCNGAVLAVNSGDTALVPTNATTGFKYINTTTFAYVESYHVTDPNDHAWDIDKYDLTPAVTTDDEWAWAVGIRNSAVAYITPDEGTTNCAAYRDNPSSGPTLLPFVEFPCKDDTFNDGNQCPPASGVGDGSRLVNTGLNDGYKDPGDNGYGYPCGLKDSQFEDGTSATDYNCPNLLYNAVLFFLLEDLDQAGATKDHNTGSADWTNDASGCDAEHPYVATEFDPSKSDDGPWPCPAGEDDREGNSHPYNPDGDWPFMVFEGRDNHGGSCDVPAGEKQGPYADDGKTNCHATRNIELMFGYVLTLPLIRTYAVQDYEGSSAPYHCHKAAPTHSLDTAGWCNQKDALGPAYPGSVSSGYP